MTLAFALGIATGILGLYLMAMGGRAIAARKYAKMAEYHFGGIVLITVSCAITYVDVGDGTFLLMQLPFLVGAAKTWAEEERWIRKLDWWPIEVPVLVNLTLLTCGFVDGVVTTVASTIQVVGMAINSSVLAMEDRRLMLVFLVVGRAGMVIGSTWKLAAGQWNATAIICILCVMLVIFDNIAQLRKAYA